MSVTLLFQTSCCCALYCVVLCVVMNERTNGIAAVLNWSGFITVLISMLCCKLWRFTVYFFWCVLKQHLFRIAHNLSACVFFLSCVCKSLWSCTLNTCNKMFSIQRPITEPPLPSNRHHRSCGDCLEGKGENYQVCSVQYCVQQLCTVRCTHTWTD